MKIPCIELAISRSVPAADSFELPQELNLRIMYIMLN